MKNKVFLLKTLKKVDFKEVIKDFLMILGIYMVSKGIYMICIPAMYIIVGIFVVYIGWPSGRAGDVKK